MNIHNTAYPTTGSTLATLNALGAAADAASNATDADPSPPNKLAEDIAYLAYNDAVYAVGNTANTRDWLARRPALVAKISARGGVVA